MSNDKAQLLADLDALDALFSDESKWTQDYWAHDRAGARVNELDDSATCWCIRGAIRRVLHAQQDAHTPLREAFHKTIGTTFIASWNDEPGRTFADIKKLIADTRARVAAQEQA